MNLSLSSKHLLFLSLQRHHNKQWGTINHIYTFQLFIFIFFPTNFFREFCTASVLASSSLFYVVRKRKDRKAYIEIQHDYKNKIVFPVSSSLEKILSSPSSSLTLQITSPPLLSHPYWLCRVLHYIINIWTSNHHL